ncbi:MAG: Small uncharacterized protein Bpro_4170, partial [uncultured Craurococcus sp.]
AAARPRPCPRRRQGRHLLHRRHRLPRRGLRPPRAPAHARAGARAFRRHRPRRGAALCPAGHRRAEFRAGGRARRRRHPLPRARCPWQVPGLGDAGDRAAGGGV